MLSGFAKAMMLGMMVIGALTVVGIVWRIISPVLIGLNDDGAVSPIQVILWVALVGAVMSIPRLIHSTFIKKDSTHENDN